MSAILNADEIALEKLEVIGRGLDSRGEIQVDCEVTARYPATVNEPVARLRIVVVDETGEWPLAACESPLVQQGLAAHPGQLALSCSLRTPVPTNVDVDDLGVRPTVLFYPIPWTRIADVALPPAGHRQSDTSVSCGDLKVNRWWVTARSSTGSFTEYEIGARVENRGSETLGLGVVRLLLEDAERRLLWSELCSAEGIGPGEERVLSGRISIAGGPQQRGMNRITLSAGAVRVPVVVPLAVWQIEMAAGSAESRSGHQAGAVPKGCH